MASCANLARSAKTYTVAICRNMSQYCFGRNLAAILQSLSNTGVTDVSPAGSLEGSLDDSSADRSAGRAMVWLWGGLGGLALEIDETLTEHAKLARTCNNLQGL